MKHWDFFYGMEVFFNTFNYKYMKGIIIMLKVILGIAVISVLVLFPIVSVILFGSMYVVGITCIIYSAIKGDNTY